MVQQIENVRFYAKFYYCKYSQDIENCNEKKFILERWICTKDLY